MLNRVLLVILIGLIGLFVWQDQKPIADSGTAEQAAKASKSEEPTLKMPDFASIQDVKQKKQAFADFMVPAIEQANQKILQQREFILGLTATKFSNLSSYQQVEFENLAENYQQPRAEGESFQAWRDKLLTKVDVIPVSLALAQAANESAWGTSRFATQGFNFYGQWCFSKGCGLVPSQRGAGEQHEVRVFANPQQSVEAYMNNLNSFHVYEFLRALRAKQRQKNQALTGENLAAGLIDYSQRREAYIKELQQMIRINNWQRLDN